MNNMVTLLDVARDMLMLIKEDLGFVGVGVC